MAMPSGRPRLLSRSRSPEPCLPRTAFTTRVSRSIVLRTRLLNLLHALHRLLYRWWCGHRLFLLACCLCARDEGGPRGCLFSMPIVKNPPRLKLRF